MQSLLTVIVPVYNAASYIDECIKSISKQTLSDIKIIIIDDGSTDDSPQICDKLMLNDSRISVIHQGNIGKLQARKRGVEVTNSKYVTFVDSDDWIDNDTYSRIVPYMEKDLDVIMYGKVVEKGARGRAPYKSKYRYGFYDKKQIEQEIYPSMIWNMKHNETGIPQSLCDKVFKTNLLKRVYEDMGSLGKINMSEDALVLFPLLQNCNNLFIMEENFYHYRQERIAVPEYLKSESFFEEMYKWYQYLDNHLDSKVFGVQLEYLYMKYVSKRKLVYDKSTNELDYIFPFKKVPVNSKIVLWGAGEVGCNYYSLLERTQYCEVVAWVDNSPNSANENVINGDVFWSNFFIYDYIVIAVNSEYVAAEIRNIILEQNVPEIKIIW